MVDTGIGEQDALWHFLRQNHPEGGNDDFAVADTGTGRDARIQSISDRADTVEAPIATKDLRFEVAAEIDSGGGAGGSEVVTHEDGVLHVTMTMTARTVLTTAASSRRW